VSQRRPFSRPHHLGRRISALADGTLTGPAADRLLAHAAHCAACRDALDQERRARTVLEALPTPAPPPELLHRLHELAEPGGPVGPRRRPMPHGVEYGRPVTSPGAALRAARPVRRPVSRIVLIGGVAVSLVALTSTAYAVGGAAAPEDGPVVPLAAATRAGEHGAAAAGRTLGGAASDAGTGTTAEVATAVGRSTALVGPPPNAPPPVGADAGELLSRAAQAARTVAYAGTRVVFGPQPGDGGRQIQVLHLPGHGTAYVGEPAGDDQGRAGFVPEPSSFAHDVALLREQYDARVAGRAEVAGRQTTVIEVGRSANEPPAARIWVDDASGLVLRKDVLGPEGVVETRTAYLEISIGSHVQGSVHLPPTDTSFAVRSLGTNARPAVVAAGWVCPESLPGGFDLVDVRRNSGDPARLQLVYSDGLTAMSVFEQPGRLVADPEFEPEVWDGRPLVVRDGLPTQAAWVADGTVWTVVTDASRERVRAAVAALPRESATADSALDRFGARIERGVTRLASWANPFA
jgi:sigma-E factor negative regulatory protein RseB